MVLPMTSGAWGVSSKSGVQGCQKYLIFQALVSRNWMMDAELGKDSEYINPVKDLLMRRFYSSEIRVPRFLSWIW